VSASASNFAEAQTMLAAMAAAMEDLALAAHWLSILYSQFSAFGFIRPYQTI